jgi:hypothetical protein
MLTAISNPKLLLTTLLLLYPNQTTLLALLVLFLRLPVCTTFPPLIDALGKVLLQAAAVVLGGYSALRVLRVVLEVSLGTPGCHSVLRAGVIVVVGEVVVLVSRLAVPALPVPGYTKTSFPCPGYTYDAS